MPTLRKLTPAEVAALEKRASQSRQWSLTRRMTDAPCETVSRQLPIAVTC
jgi:hypothetical protein